MSDSRATASRRNHALWIVGLSSVIFLGAALESNLLSGLGYYFMGLYIGKEFL